MGQNDIIHPDLIFLDEEYTDKASVIRKIAETAHSIGYLQDAEAFFQSVMKREEEVPTAIGYDVAIPHGKTDAVLKPFIAFFRTKETFTWTPGFEEVVQLIFQIGVPEAGTEKLHLKFISQVSKKLLDEEFRNQLTVIKEKNEVYQLLQAIEV